MVAYRDRAREALRTERSSPALIPEVRAAVARVEPGFALSDVRTMDEGVSESLRQQRVSAVLIEAYSLGALLPGVPGINFSARVIRGVLVGVCPFDPVTLGAVATGMPLVAQVACYLPARRVTRIEPARSLRQD